MGMVDVEKIAEAVLYEGYLLFPYRRSAMKNQQRWTFGGVYPRQVSEATGGDDPWLMQTQCLVEGDDQTEVAIKVRFLHVVDRKVKDFAVGTSCFVDALQIDGQTYRPWDEAMERQIVCDDGQPGLPLTIGNLLAEERQVPISVEAGNATETLCNARGVEVGALVREWRALEGTIEITVEAAERRYDTGEKGKSGQSLYRLTVRIINNVPWPNGSGATFSRNDVLRQTFVSTHTILSVRRGDFVSLLEPPDSCKQAADGCENIKTWPVLVDEPGERSMLLSSPIILYDYPQVSPESHGNYFDATEIDELLALSVMTLTDDEKQEMRESDCHSREILERTEALSEEHLLKLHGVVRYLNPVRRGQE